MDLDEIKRRKMEELRKKLEEKKRMEMIKKSLLSRFLTQKARERLARIRMVKPELVEYVENLLIGLYQSGRVSIIDDKTLKEILGKIYEKTRKDFNIKIIRK